MHAVNDAPSGDGDAINDDGGRGYCSPNGLSTYL